MIRRWLAHLRSLLQWFGPDPAAPTERVARLPVPGRPDRSAAARARRAHIVAALSEVHAREREEAERRVAEPHYWRGVGKWMVRANAEAARAVCLGPAIHGSWPPLALTLHDLYSVRERARAEVDDEDAFGSATVNAWLGDVARLARELDEPLQLATAALRLLQDPAHTLTLGRWLAAHRGSDVLVRAYARGCWRLCQAIAQGNARDAERAGSIEAPEWTWLEVAFALRRGVEPSGGLALVWLVAGARQQVHGELLRAAANGEWIGRTWESPDADDLPEDTLALAHFLAGVHALGHGGAGRARGQFLAAARQPCASIAATLAYIELWRLQ